MAKFFYAYLPVLFKQLYEGVSGDFKNWEEIVLPFLRGVDPSEKAVIVSEIDRLTKACITEDDLLKKIWWLGARDFPGGDIRESLDRIRMIVTSSADDELP